MLLLQLPAIMFSYFYNLAIILFYNLMEHKEPKSTSFHRLVTIILILILLILFFNFIFGSKLTL